MMMMMMIPLKETKRKEAPLPLVDSACAPPRGPPAAASQDAHDAEAETLTKVVVSACSSRK